MFERLKKLVHVHGQNFTADRDERDFGKLPWSHARAWISLGPTTKNEDRPVVVYVSWNLWASFIHANLKFKPWGGGEARATASVACGPAVWIGIGGALVDKIKVPEAWSRDFGVNLFDKTIHVDFATDGSGWDNKHWWSRHWSFRPVDAVLGKDEHSQRVIETVPVVICMPEAQYKGTCKVVERTYRRRRWPFTRRLITTVLDVPQGVPQPGKGTESWNCDEDACFGQSGPAKTPEAAVASFVQHVLERRTRYGGRGWTPEPRKKSA